MLEHLGETTAAARVEAAVARRGGGRRGDARSRRRAVDARVRGLGGRCRREKPPDEQQGAVRLRRAAQARGAGSRCASRRLRAADSADADAPVGAGAEPPTTRRAARLHRERAGARRGAHRSRRASAWCGSRARSRTSRRRARGTCTSRSRTPSAQLPAVMFRSSAERLQVRAARRAEGARARAAARSTRRRASSSSTSTRSSRPGSARCSSRSSSSRRSSRPRGCSTPRASGRCRRWPRRIGIVTSPTGAAVRDILRIAERRGRMRFLDRRPARCRATTAPVEIIARHPRASSGSRRRRDHRRRAAAARPRIWRRSTTRRWRARSPPAACRW